MLKETLINCLCGMKRKAHGTQKPRHINRIVEVASTAQRSDSPAQAINQGFLDENKASLLEGFKPLVKTVRQIRPHHAGYDSPGLDIPLIMGNFILGLSVLLTAAFTILKLCRMVDWAWLLVFAPACLSFVMVFVIGMIVTIAGIIRNYT